MKTLLRVALGGLIVGAGLSAHAAQVELMVKYKTNSSPQLINASIGAKTLRDMPEIGWQKVSLPATVSMDRATRYFRSLSTVAAVEPVAKRKLFLTPNDAKYSQQYAPQNIGMPAAWEYSLGSPEVVVAVIDTGVRASHQDLAANLVSGGYDYANGDADISDGFGHGTAVSGCVSAVTNNNLGIAGTGWNVKVYNVKVFSDGAGTTSNDVIVKGILDAANRKVRIINMSLGGPGATQAELDAVNYALDQNCLIVASAGNEGTNVPNYPASFPGVLSVGATDSADKQADFTSFGPTVDVAAPGVQVLTTTFGGDSEYSKVDGTSFSSPITAGALALMASYAPGSTNEELTTALTSTTKDVGTWLRYGRINVAAAIALLRPPVVTDYNPSTATLMEGRLVNSQGSDAGNAGLLKEADNAYYDIASVYSSKVGSLASVRADLPVVYDPSRLSAARFQLDMTSSARVTALVSLYNWSTGSYDLYNSYTLTVGTTRSINAAFPKAMLTKYVSNGKMRVMLRTVLPSRLGGTTGISYNARFDRLGVQIIERAASGAQ